MKELIRYLLKNRMQFQDDWTVQGFGFARLRINDSQRIHIWDSRLRTPEVSDIHDHTQWAFESRIISGSLVNVRYLIDDRGIPFNTAVLQCGIGGGMVADSKALVRLRAQTPELYVSGDTYKQEPDEIHRTLPVDGTVTWIKQERRDVDTARVFWPVGGVWGDAIPRKATQEEIRAVGEYALSIFQ